MQGFPLRLQTPLAPSWKMRLALVPFLWLCLTAGSASAAVPACSDLVPVEKSPDPVSCLPCSCFAANATWLVAQCRGLRLDRPPETLPPDTDALCFHGNRADQLSRGMLSKQVRAHLSVLELSGNALSKISLDAFADLLHLQTLDLSSNALSSLEGDTFFDLRELQDLDLSTNHISSLDGRLFQNLYHLKGLNLSNNAISTLNNWVFDKLSNLTHLDLSSNKLSFLDGRVFENLANLFHLDLSHNKIVALEGNVFEHLSRLVLLDLSNNNITRSIDVQAFSGLGNLRALSLQHNKLRLKSGVYPDDVFKPLGSLRILLLNGNSPVSCQEDMDYPDLALSQLPSLCRLSIDGLCNVSFGLGFANLTRLQYLSLSGRTGYCHTRMLGDDTFVNLPHLTHLNLSLCGIDDLGKNVFKPLSHLRALDLSCNYHLGFHTLGIAGHGLAHAMFEELHVDFIHSRYAIHVTVERNHTEFLTNTNLKHLRASGNRIEGFERGVLRRLPKTLTSVVAKYNRFTFGEYILELPSLTGVQSIDVGNGGIDTDLPRGDAAAYHSRYCLDNKVEPFPGTVCVEDDCASGVRAGNGLLPESDPEGADRVRGQTGVGGGEPSSFQPERGTGAAGSAGTTGTPSQQRVLRFKPRGFRELLHGPVLLAGPWSSQELPEHSSATTRKSRTGPSRSAVPTTSTRPLTDQHGSSSFVLSGRRTRLDVATALARGASPPPHGTLGGRRRADSSLGSGACGSVGAGVRINLPPKLTRLAMQWSHLYYHVGQVQFNESNRLQYLDLSCNGLSALIGPVKGLQRLVHLDLSTNFAHYIGPQFFLCMTGLRSLNLSDNHFDERIMSNDTFRYLSHLRTLDLSNNRLAGINATALERLTSLTHLIISDNKVTAPFLNINVSKLQALEELILSWNNLNYLTDTLMKSLNDIASRNNTVKVDLSWNPIACSCESLHFLRWMQKSKVLFINTHSYFCLLSNGTAVPMRNLTEWIHTLRKQCRSKIPLYFTIVLTGSILTILVTTVGAICYRFRWKMRYLYYAYLNRRRSLEDGGIFQYDAFISYGEDDCDFVHGDLLARLEDKEGLRVCIHARDFVPGRPIASNILEAIQNSRRTVCIISKDFLESYWCRYELQMAKMESLHTGREVVLMVLYENIRACSLPTEVLYYVQTDTYVEYPRDHRCLKFFWDNLVRALR